MITPLRAAAKFLTRDEARRIAAEPPSFGAAAQALMLNLAGAQPNHFPHALLFTHGEI